MAKEEKVLSVAEERVTPSYMQDQRRSTKEQLDAQPKVKIRIPPAKKGDLPYEVVGINGYNYQILKGKEVEVPETVYRILQEANII